MERTVLAEIDFGPWPTAPDREWLQAADHAYEGLVGDLLRNSQIIGEPAKGIVQARLKAFVRLPAVDALASEHASNYVRRSLKEVETVFGTEPRVTILDPGGQKPATSWQDAAYLVVCGGAPDGLAPLRNETGVPVPSYLLPIDEQLSEGLCFWARRNEYLEGLWFASDLEEESLRQLADPRSGHRQESRELATRIEQATKKQVYTCLFRHYGFAPDDEATRLCPLCGKAWRVRDELWDFRCEPCRLVSHLAPALDENGWARIGAWSA